MPTKNEQKFDFELPVINAASKRAEHVCNLHIFCTTYLEPAAVVEQGPTFPEDPMQVKTMQMQRVVEIDKVNLTTSVTLPASYPTTGTVNIWPLLDALGANQEIYDAAHEHAATL